MASSVVNRAFARAAKTFVAMAPTGRRGRAVKGKSAEPWRGPQPQARTRGSARPLTEGAPAKAKASRAAARRWPRYRPPEGNAIDEIDRKEEAKKGGRSPLDYNQPFSAKDVMSVPATTK